MQALEIKLLYEHRRTKIQVPEFWEYVEKFNKEERSFFEVNGIKLFVGTSSDFLRMVAKERITNPGWEPTEVDWTVDCLMQQLPHSNCSIAIVPDGQIFVRKPGACLFITAIVPPESQAKKAKHKSNNAIYRYMSAAHDAADDEYRKPDWGKCDELLLSLEAGLFVKTFKETRKKWLNQSKDSGQWKEALERQKARRLADRTNRKMTVCNQVTTVIEMLQQYLKDINDGTATQKQVGEIYYEMNTLGSLNKRVKTLFRKE